MTLASNSTLNRNAFLKLLALGLFDILLTFPLTVLILIMDLLGGDIPGFWPGWEAAHSFYSTIPQVPAQVWKASGFWVIFTVEFDLWVNLVFAIAFFFIFGTSQQKRAWYRSIFWKAMRLLGYKPSRGVDPVASAIVFGSGPMAHSVIGGPDARVVTVM